MSDIITLAIESSCDETAASVLKNGREVLSNIISTQIETHKKIWWCSSRSGLKKTCGKY